MPKRKLMPDVVKDQELACLSPDTSVKAAAQFMADRRIAAILVTEGKALKGIFTERDITTRVVAAGRNVEATTLAEVMTRNPDTLTPDATAMDALNLMEQRRYRHLPVVTPEGEVKGIVSIRDLFAVVRRHLEEEIKDREAFMFGSGYSAGAAG